MCLFHWMIYEMFIFFPVVRTHPIRAVEVRYDNAYAHVCEHFWKLRGVVKILRARYARATSLLNPSRIKFRTLPPPMTVHSHAHLTHTHTHTHTNTTGPNPFPTVYMHRGEVWEKGPLCVCVCVCGPRWGMRERATVCVCVCVCVV